MTAPTDGYILHAEAYPYDENFVSLDLMYCESEEQLNNHKFMQRRFYVRKDVAQTLTKGIIDILAAPDTATAWGDIMRSLPEANEPDLSDFDGEREGQ